MRVVWGKRDTAPMQSGRRDGNRLSPMGFVLAFGLVSGLGDVVYEGARSITGPLLASFGAGAGLVGFITGAGEAVALVLRLPFGVLSDRTGRPWPVTIAGYAITMVAAPLMALSWALWPAAVLVVLERFGKAVRTPSRDTMLAQASVEMGRGRAFALHEALDQTGALIGPLVMAGAIAVTGGLRWGFAVLAVPAITALAVLTRVRLAAPRPDRYEHAGDTRAAGVDQTTRLPRRFWLYAAFAAINMLGFATWGVVAFHLQQRHVVSTATVPVMYALAMGLAAVGALASGWLYDHIGLRGLGLVPLLTATVPFLAFSTDPAVAWAGAAVWGLGLGIHESTMRAAVADLVPVRRRGTGFAMFTAIYGMAWLVGGTLLGVSYGHSPETAQVVVVGTQVFALLAFVPLFRPMPPAGPSG
jgi:MFS family permease